MRRLLTLFVALFAVTMVSAQNARILSPEVANQRVTQLPSQIEPSMLDLNTARQAPGVVSTPSYSTDAVTSQLIAQASNAYTFLVLGNHQLSVVNDLDAVAFIHRQDISLHGGATADNGRLRMGISTDGGVTWDTEKGPINPDYDFVARYPNMLLTTNGGSTVADIDYVYVAPTLATSSFWDAHVAGYLEDASNATVNVTDEQYIWETDGLYLPNSLTERVPGEFWYTNVRYNTAAEVRVPEIEVMKGVASGSTVTWTREALIVPTFDTQFDGTARFTSPHIAFSPDGVSGYIALLGDLAGQGQDSLYAPIFMESKDGGQTWGAPYEFDMTFCQELYDSLTFFQVIDSVNNDTIPFGTGEATTSFDCDLTVDKDGNPHLISLVANGALYNERPQYSLYSGIWLGVYDFTKDEFGDWNMIYIASQSTLRGDFGQGADPADNFTADSWVQVGRNPDGDVIIYSWTDTDTTNGVWVAGDGNNAPNLKGAAYNVDTEMLTDVVDWTVDDAIWSGAALIPKIAPVCFDDGAGNYTVPTVVMTLEGTSAIDPVSFHYYSDVMYADADFTRMAGFCFNCKSTPYTNNVSTIDAGCGANDGEATITVAGGNAPYDIAWSNGDMGATASGLGVGVYTVTVVDDRGCVDEQTVTVNNANAPSLAVSGVSDPACEGDANGTATVTATGGTAPYTYDWSNGETTDAAMMLPGGQSTVTVTDDAGCSSVEVVDLTTPPAINVETESVNVLCFGGSTGEIMVDASGGTGSLSYAWSDDSGVTTPDRTNLPAGDYTVTVIDDNGCDEEVTVSVTEPAELELTFSTTWNGTTGTATATVTGGTPTPTYLWDNGSTTSFIFNLSAGTYSVTVTDGNGCTITDEVVVGDGTSIDKDLAGINEMSVFPNPAATQLNVALELANVNDLQVSLINTNGQVVMSRTANGVANYETTIDVADLAAGIYTLNVTTATGSVSTRVIVK